MRLNAKNFDSISLNKDGSYHICIVSDDQVCMYEQMVTFLAQNAYVRHILSKNKAFGGLGSCDNVQAERSISEYANWFEYANWSV